MQPILRFTDRIARLLALLAAIGVLAMMLHVGADVIWRTLSGRPLPATVEIVSRYYMVVIAFLPVALVERQNAMISVELIDAAMTPALRRASDVAVALLALAIYAVMVWTTWTTAMQNFHTGTFVVALNSKIPVWQTYFIPPVGFALAGLVVLVRLAELVSGSRADDRRTPS